MPRLPQPPTARPQLPECPCSSRQPLLPGAQDVPRLQSRQPPAYLGEEQGGEPWVVTRGTEGPALQPGCPPMPQAAPILWATWCLPHSALMSPRACLEPSPFQQQGQSSSASAPRPSPRETVPNSYPENFYPCPTSLPSGPTQSSCASKGKSPGLWKVPCLRPWQSQGTCLARAKSKQTCYLQHAPDHGEAACQQEHSRACAHDEQEKARPQW